jgi:glycosyltransferase involved in cell wall biosynthesis
MTKSFDEDEYPGRPRILFIGFPESSHTHSWIDLLADEKFNIRLFGLPSAEPPAEWPVRTYLSRSGAPRFNDITRQTVFPPPDSSISGMTNLANTALSRGLFSSNPWLRGKIHSCISIIDRMTRGGKNAVTVEEALAKVVQSWKPDIIHTLGFDSASYFYLRARKQFRLEGIGRWVAQARGGPDLSLQRYSPDFKLLIEDVLETCDHFIADNEPNYSFALSAGLAASKIKEPGMGIVSGAGGIDVEGMRAMWSLPPSKRERIIVWPKAYETYTAKAMPVFEAILKVWDQIQPCRIEMLWMVQPDIKIWYEKMFPQNIKFSCPTFGRLSREDTLQRISNARVMLAPSLSDGIPNTMMEAMALGAAPLVSPLDTIQPVVQNGENVLFARNLYPDEIAAALVRLMSDDDLVDRMAGNNIKRVYEMADREKVRARALEFYERVAALNRAQRADV